MLMVWYIWRYKTISLLFRRRRHLTAARAILGLLRLHGNISQIPTRATK